MIVLKFKTNSLRLEQFRNLFIDALFVIIGKGHKIDF